jgi:hypothetical protein
MEWTEGFGPVEYLSGIVSNEMPTEKLLNPNPEIRITDDKPYNEYYMLRDRRYSPN